MSVTNHPRKTFEPGLDLECRDGAAILTIDRPDSRNSLGKNFAASLVRALDSLERDPGVHAIVLTGTGNVFCAGAELGAVVSPEGIDQEVQFGAIRDYNRLIIRLRELELPIIAAVNGPAVGGGAALALGCDIAIASENANYFFAFGRLGAAACDMACAWILPKIVGTVVAQHWFLTGATVGAEQGLRHGLFVEVVPQDRLVERAVEIAQRIRAATPRRAAAATKQAVLRGQDADFQSCAIYEPYIQAYMFTTSEHKERLASLMAAIKKNRAST